MTHAAHDRPALDLLRELGIAEPNEIDVEAIAQHCGATVIERPLTGCEARIIGVGDRAVITVNSSSIPRRRRFSAAHELGHWIRDKGLVAVGCVPESGYSNDPFNRETRANRYAGELLMPRFMFTPRAENRPIVFETVEDLAVTFDTSLTATAIRLVDLGSFPGIVVCTGRKGVQWFSRGADVPETLWPETNGRDTFAGSMLRGEEQERSGDVSSAAWFPSLRRNHWVYEDSRRITPDLVLSLLSWKDESPLMEMQEEEDRRASRRFDGRDD
jgi:hypothetical protein